MNFNRNIIVCILALVSCEAAIPPRHPGRSLLFFPPFTKPLPNKPFGIFSRPPPSDEQHKQGGQQTNQGGSIAVHVGNVLHGGSIGIQIRPLAPLQGILEHAKKFIPGHGTVGRPSHDRPDHEDRPNHEYPKHEKPLYHERPHKDQPPYERPHEVRPNHEYPKHDRPPYYERPHKDYERPHQRPNTDQPTKDDTKEWEKDDTKEWEEAKDPSGHPQWEDIGEVPSEEEYGEGVLQPRVRRPKRFVESKIYHVPLLFRSNGRAERVRIKGRNGLRERKNSED